MNKIRNLWDRLTAPRSADEDIARREYLTRATLTIMGAALTVFNLLMLTGLGLGWFDGLDMLISLSVTIPLTICWWLAQRGIWRPGSYLPSVIFFLLGAFGSYSIGLGTSFLLCYAIAILLASMLVSDRAMAIVYSASILVHATLGWQSTHKPPTELKDSVFLSTALLTGITLLQWFASMQYRRTLATAHTVDARLREEILVRKQAEEEKRLISEAYKLTLQHSQNNVFRLRRRIDGEIIFTMNEGKLATTSGMTTEAVHGKSLKEIAGEKYSHLLTPYFQRAFSGEVVTYEFQMGGLFFTTVLSPLETDGEIVEVIGSSVDITENKIAQERLIYLSNYDILTGLFNRNFFETEIDRLQNSRSLPLTVIITDIDDLKKVNDRFGHAAGDDLLKRTARVLKESFRKEEIIARIGGDEFAVLLPNTDAQSAKIALERLGLQISIDNQHHPDAPLNLSIGMATGGKEMHVIDLMKKADRRMYNVKWKHQHVRYK